MTKPRRSTGRIRRSLRNEVLEPRLLLANDLPFQNPGQRFDVNRDLTVSALDALQIINLIGRNGGDIALPSTNEGIRFPDVNGSNSVTSLDALQIINRLDSTSPIPAARLIADSARGGSNNLDFVTNQYGLEFGISFGVGPQQLELRVDGDTTDSFVIIGIITGSERLTLDESQLDAFAGSPLGDGEHQFEIRVAGEEGVQAFVVTVDTTAPLPPTDVRLTPATDSGVSDSDGITNVSSPDVQGEAETGSLVTVRVNGRPAGQTIASSPWQIENITLVEGPNSLAVSAIDIAGNQSDATDSSIELDSIPPTSPTFDLSEDTDTDVPGDQTTEREFVTLVGQADPLTVVRFPSHRRDEVSGADGSFKLFGVPLKLGSNPLAALAEDLAGNSSSFSADVIRQARTGFSILQESSGLVVEQSQTVDLNPTSGSRTLRFEIDTGFDTTDDSAAIEDVLAIYLVDPANPSTTILDRDEPGTALFTLAGDAADFVPGQVRFDGTRVEIDVTSVTGFTQGELLFQLINSDTDTGSQVAIGPIANEVETDNGVGPVFPLRRDLTLAGDPIDTNTLSPATSMELQVRNVRFDSSNGHYAAELSLHNNGEALGRSLAVVLTDLPSGVTVNGTSGVDDNGDPYFNFTPAVANGGLDRDANSAPILLQIDNPSLTPFSLRPIVLSDGPNRPPQLDPIGPLRVMPGDVLKVPLVATDPDGDAITFSVLGDLPNSRLTSDSHLIVTPNPTQIGSYTFDLVAGDAMAATKTTVTLDVVADPVSTTRISGWILNTLEEPLANIPVELGSEQTRTGDDGLFTLTLPGGLQADTLKVFGQAFAGPAVYPFIAEKLGLILPQGVFENVNNVVSRPIYLPALEVTGGTTIDPAQDMTIGAPSIPGMGLFVGAGTLRDQQGGLYDDVLSITEVPVDLTPAALPPNLLTELVVTIQPGEMVFDIPAPLTFPNRSGLDPGTPLDLYSINPVTGEFDLVGKSQVSTDGSVIEPIWGGVRNSSWHFVSVPPEVPEDPEDDPRKRKQRCNDCEDRVLASSEVTTHGGALIEFHSLVSYQSLGQSRGLTFVYDSERADPRPILPVGFENVAFDPDDRLVARVDIHSGSSRLQVPGIPPGTVAGVRGGENFWTIPSAGGSITASLQVDMTQMPSGRYPYEQSTGVLRLGNNSLNGTMTDASSNFIHVNSIQSPFGAGWGLAGLGQAIVNDDGSLLLVDGDGSELLFEPPTMAGGTFISPDGDFTVLQQLPGGDFLRTFPDQSSEAYDAGGRLSSVTDRNNNHTAFTYDPSGNLTTITDPANLVTTLRYTRGLVTSVVDPASRTTSFEYDERGNLTKITDPDGSFRTFEYDSRHHLTSEIDKRGIREQVSYGFHGRVERVTRGDGTQQFFDPLQTQGLYWPESTTDPLNAPAAIVDPGPLVSIVDPNGDVSLREIDQAGQLVTITDDIGVGPQVLRDAENLIRIVTDARGNKTFFDYDDRGNRIRKVDSEDGPALVAGSITALGETDTYEFHLAAAAGFYVDAISELTSDPSKIHVALQKMFAAQWLPVTDANLDRVDSNGVANEDVVTFLTAGTYRLVVSGVGDHTGEYAFQPQSISAGVPITLGQPVTGVTDQPSGSDLYTLAGQQGDQWIVTSQQPSTPLGAFIRLIDPTGFVLDRFTLSRTSDLVTLPRDGLYTVLIEGALGTTDVTNYAFTVRQVNAPVRSAEINQPIGGNLVDAGQVDRYSINLTQESLVRVDLRSVDAVITLRMTGPTGEIIPQTSLAALDTRDGALRLRPGTYELQIEAIDGPGQYHLRLIDLFQAESISLGDRVIGGNTSGRNATSFRLDAVAGDQLRVELLNRTAVNAPDTRVRVFDQHGGQLIHQSLAGLNSPLQALFDGPLFFEFDARIISTNSSNPDFFVFSVTREGSTPPSPIGGTPLVFNQQIEGTVESATPDTFEFTLTERVLVRLDARTDSSQLRMSLSGDQGTLLDDARFDLNGTERFFDLPAGHYRVDVRTTAATSDYAFSMLVADQNVLDIGGQLGNPQFVSLPSETTALLRVTLDQATSLFGEFGGFASFGTWLFANSSGRVLASDSLDSDLPIGAVEAGTYFLAINHLFTTPLPQALSFTLKEQVTKQFEIALGDPIVGTLDVFGDQDIYRFSLDRTQTVHLACQSPNSSVRFTIDGPSGTLFDGARMADCANDRTDISNLTSELPPGDYSVAIQSVKSGQVAYDLRLLDLSDLTMDSDGNLDGTLDPFTTEVVAVAFASKSAIVIESNNNALDLVVELVNADGSDFNPTIRFRNNVNIPFNATSITVEGDYFVVVHNLGSDATSFSYTINVLTTLPSEPDVESVTPLRIADRLGTNIEYDETFGIPTRYTSSEGRTIELELDSLTGDILKVNRIGDDGFVAVDQFTYDLTGQIISQIDGEDRRTDFEYDTLGRLVATTEAPGTSIEAVTDFEYDAAGNQTGIMTPRGGRIERHFDPMNRLLRSEGPDPDDTGPLAAPIETLHYDTIGNLIRVIDPLGHETRLRYDERNRPVEIRDPLANTSQFRYDDAGNNIEIVDRRGHSTLQRFDSRGRISETTNALGNQFELHYDDDNNLLQIVNPLGEMTHFEYDARNRVDTITNPLGQSTRRAYDSDSFLVTQTDANGNRSRFDYDDLGRLVSSVDALGQMTNLEYDASDLLVRSTNRIGQVATTDYDARGRVIVQRDALGGELEFEYDASGNLISTTDQLGNITTYTYDLLNRLTTRIDPDPDGVGSLLSPITTFTYDVAGNPVSRTDAVGNTTSYQYDSLDRVVVETDPRDQTRSFTYDAVGNLASRTDRNGRVTTFQYDALNRQVGETWLDNNQSPVHQFDFAYDPVGRLLSATDTDTTLTSDYDAVGRALSTAQNITGAPAVLLTYSHDAVGNRTQMLESIDSVAAGFTRYFYDALNRNVRIEQAAQQGAVDPVAEKRVDLLYNAIGQFDRITRYADLAGQTQATDSRYTYDELSRLSSITHRDATDAVLASYSYAYDAASRITQIADVDGTADYRYDGVSRLIAADHSDDARDESYAYDAAGNRTSSHLHNFDYVTETSNRVTSDGQFTYQHDAEGNTTRRIDTISGENREFDYDHRNRLVRVTHRASAGGIISAETMYQYDAFNRRVAKHHDADGEGNQKPSSEYYFHDGNQIVLEFADADGPSGAATPLLIARNLYGPGIDFLLAVEQPEANRALWTLADHQRTTRDIVTPDGSQHNHLIYDAYGNVLSQSNPNITTRFLYTGREFDSESGLYYHRERFYDPNLGRFLNEDPIGFAGGNNLFAYVGADPVNKSDPFGQQVFGPEFDMGSLDFSPPPSFREEAVRRIEQRNIDAFLSVDSDPILTQQRNALVQTRADLRAEIRKFQMSFGENSPITKSAENSLDRQIRALQDVERSLINDFLKDKVTNPFIAAVQVRTLVDIETERRKGDPRIQLEVINRSYQMRVEREAFLQWKLEVNFADFSNLDPCDLERRNRIGDPEDDLGPPPPISGSSRIQRPGPAPDQPKAQP